MNIYPGYDEIKAYKEEYKMYPVCQEFYADVITPITLLRKIATLDDSYFLLESAEDGVGQGRYSFLGYDPILRFSSKGGVTTMKSGELITETKEDPLDSIRKVVEAYRSPKLPDMPPFTGGLVGYFGYEMIRTLEKTLEIRSSEYDDYKLMLCDKLFVFDNMRQKIMIIVNMKLSEGEKGYTKALLEIEKMRNLLYNDILPKCEKSEEANFTCNTTKEEYIGMVEKTRRYIREGDIFQAVISRRFESDYHGSLLNAYRVLRTSNPSPYMYYIMDEDINICGASPETMVKVIGDKITTFPVAGTRPRGKTFSEDERLERELLADEKELAEHNMLVDLARNDVGRIAEYGSVNVDEYMKIHRFSKVMHIASVVTGKLSKDHDAYDAIKSLLPAGTLSGAPKYRAMEIIDELEKAPRGIYGGAIGYVDLSGNVDVCICIRTAIKKGDKVYVQAGAGIVADSVPENEYMECYNKALAVMDAIKKASEVE